MRKGKKQFLTVALAVVMVVCLVGCGQEVQDKSDKNSQSMFVCIETTTNWKVVYHKDTKVMYAVSNRRYNRGVFTPLYNADGTLQIYEESED